MTEAKVEYTISLAPQGWVCPKCDTVWAPHIDSCLDCKWATKMEIDWPPDSTAGSIDLQAYGAQP